MIQNTTNNTIRIAICGYGNLGRGVESEVSRFSDLELVAIFTRRPTGSVKTVSGVPTIHVDEAKGWIGKVDVLILCGGSKDDLPTQTPHFASMFNCIDSFDTHAQIPKHLATVDAAAKMGNKLSVISVGWDPGVFSLMRLYMDAVLPDGKTYSFWGPGVSQGHSDAIRRVKGVVGGVQYTQPVDSALAKVRKGITSNLTARQKHTRVCFVAIEEGASRRSIEKQIKEMPDYFADYDTTVNFVTLEELQKKHSKLPHGGNVIHIGKTGTSHAQKMEFSLKLDSNPEFTSSVLLAYARAAYRLNKLGETGAKTVFDIAPKWIVEGDISVVVKETL